MLLRNFYNIPVYCNLIRQVERLLGIPELRGTTRQATAAGFGTTAGTGGRACCVLPACAVTGEGVDCALEQLYQMIRARRKASKQSTPSPNSKDKTKSTSSPQSPSSSGATSSWKRWHRFHSAICHVTSRTCSLQWLRFRRASNINCSWLFLLGI